MSEGRRFLASFAISLAVHILILLLFVILRPSSPRERYIEVVLIPGRSSGGVGETVGANTVPAQRVVAAKGLETKPKVLERPVERKSTAAGSPSSVASKATRPKGSAIDAEEGSRAELPSSQVTIAGKGADEKEIGRKSPARGMPEVATSSLIDEKAEKPASEEPAIGVSKSPAESAVGKVGPSERAVEKAEEQLSVKAPLADSGETTVGAEVPKREESVEPASSLPGFRIHGEILDRTADTIRKVASKISSPPEVPRGQRGEERSGAEAVKGPQALSRPPTPQENRSAEIAKTAKTEVPRRMPEDERKSREDVEPRFEEIRFEDIHKSTEEIPKIEGEAKPTRVIDALEKESVADAGALGKPSVSGGEYGVEGQIRGRRLLHYTVPEYPESAERAGISATVKVKIWVAPEGVVREARAIQVSGYREFEISAENAIRRWRWEAVDPSVGDQWGIVTVNYRIKPREPPPPTS
ncbi:MAG: TonB family protein [bacterium]